MTQTYRSRIVIRNLLTQGHMQQIVMHTHTMACASMAVHKYVQLYSVHTSIARRTYASTQFLLRETQVN